LTFFSSNCDEKEDALANSEAKDNYDPEYPAFDPSEE